MAVPDFLDFLIFLTGFSDLSGISEFCGFSNILISHVDVTNQTNQIAIRKKENSPTQPGEQARENQDKWDEPDGKNTQTQKMRRSCQEVKAK